MLKFMLDNKMLFVFKTITGLIKLITKDFTGHKQTPNPAMLSACNL